MKEIYENKNYLYSRATAYTAQQHALLHTKPEGGQQFGGFCRRSKIFKIYKFLIFLLFLNFYFFKMSKIFEKS